MTDNEQKEQAYRLLRALDYDSMSELPKCMSVVSTVPRVPVFAWLYRKGWKKGKWREWALWLHKKLERLFGTKELITPLGLEKFIYTVNQGFYMRAPDFDVPFKGVAHSLLIEVGPYSWRSNLEPVHVEPEDQLNLSYTLEATT